MKIPELKGLKVEEAKELLDKTKIKYQSDIFTFHITLYIFVILKSVVVY